jgi:glucosamine--fructose-6-phosphate aminotransferase (isomerizing)
VTAEEYQPDITLAEIYSQARSCEETLRRAPARLNACRDLLPLEQYTDLILTGCGSSYNLAKCAAFAWNRVLSRPVHAVASSELMFSPELFLEPGARPLVVAISRTGGTTEVRLAVERLRTSYGARALAVTGEPKSSIGAVCDVEIAFTECLEQSVVMTQAFTCMLTGLYAITDGAAGWPCKREISRIPELIAASLGTSQDLLRPIAEEERTKTFFFLGSGAMKGLADECALKMTEMALSAADAHRSLEFRHGPKAMLDHESQIVMFPIAAERPYLETLFSEIQATDASMLLIGEDAYGRGRHFTNIELGAELQEVFRPAVYAHVGHLLAFWRAMSKGLSPRSPRHLDRTVLLDT